MTRPPMLLDRTSISLFHRGSIQKFPDNEEEGKKDNARMAEQNDPNWSRPSSLPKQRLLLRHKLCQPNDVVVHRRYELASGIVSRVDDRFEEDVGSGEEDLQTFRKLGEAVNEGRASARSFEVTEVTGRGVRICSTFEAV